MPNNWTWNLETDSRAINIICLFTHCPPREIRCYKPTVIPHRNSSHPNEIITILVHRSMCSLMFYWNHMVVSCPEEYESWRSTIFLSCSKQHLVKRQNYSEILQVLGKRIWFLSTFWKYFYFPFFSFHFYQVKIIFEHSFLKNR